MRIIDPAIGLAHQLDGLLGIPQTSADQNISLNSCRFCVTADPSGFAARATPWLGERPNVELVNLRSIT